MVFVYVTAASGFPGPFLFVFGGLWTRGYAADSDGVADWRPLRMLILLLVLGLGVGSLVWRWLFAGDGLRSALPSENLRLFPRFVVVMGGWGIRTSSVVVLVIGAWGLLTRGYAAVSDGVADWRPLRGVIWRLFLC